MSEGCLDNLPFIVIGGGIGGTAAALALSRKGKRVLVLEQAVDLTEIGAGIQMPPNAFKAFDAIGVLEAVQQVAASAESLILGDMLTGAVVYQTPIGNAFIERFRLPLCFDASRRSASDPRLGLQGEQRHHTQDLYSRYGLS